MNEILHQEIAKLRGELSDAYAEIEHLKGLFSETEKYPSKFKLANREAQVLNRLRKTQAFCTHRHLNVAIGKDPDHTGKLVDVYIYWLRKKLGPYGVRIRNSYGDGYYIDQDSRENLRKALLNNEPLRSRRSIEREWREARIA